MNFIIVGLLIILIFLTIGKQLPILKQDGLSEVLTTRIKVLLVVSILIIGPFISGIIFFIAWRKKFPIKAKQALRFSFIASAIYVVLAGIIIALVFFLISKPQVLGLPADSMYNTGEYPSGLLLPDKYKIYTGCILESFEQSKSIGINMMAQKCSQIDIDGFLVMFSVSTDTKTVYRNYVDKIRPQDTTTHPVVEVFNKSSEQSLEQGVKEQFLNRLSVASKSCIVVKRLEKNTTDNTSGSIAALNKERYDIMPNPARKKILDAKAGTDIPDYSECGRYAISSDGQAYFEYQPNNTKSKFVYVNLGQDEPFYDPESINIFNPQ